MIYTRERYPIQWAMTQSNLGRMYIDRAQGRMARTSSARLNA